MSAIRLNPWNWFKKEEDQHRGASPQTMLPAEMTSSLRQLEAGFDRLFEDFFNSPFRGNIRRLRDVSPGFSVLETGIKPKLDVASTDKEYTISVELPGVDEKDVQVEMVNDSLVIRGEKKHEEKHEETGYYHMERSYGSFQRVLALPADADTAGIKATHKAGVLTVTMPKKAVEAAGTKSIPIMKEE